MACPEAEAYRACWRAERAARSRRSVMRSPVLASKRRRCPQQMGSDSTNYSRKERSKMSGSSAYREGVQLEIVDVVAMPSIITRGDRCQKFVAIALIIVARHRAADLSRGYVLSARAHRRR